MAADRNSGRKAKSRGGRGNCDGRGSRWGWSLSDDAAAGADSGAGAGHGTARAGARAVPEREGGSAGDDPGGHRSSRVDPCAPWRAEEGEEVAVEAVVAG